MKFFFPHNVFSATEEIKVCLIKIAYIKYIHVINAVWKFNDEAAIKMDIYLVFYSVCDVSIYLYETPV